MFTEVGLIVAVNAVSLHTIGLTLKTIKLAVFLTTVMPVTYKYILRFL